MNRSAKLGFAAVLLLVALLSALTLIRQRQVLYPMPSPNAYQEFLQATAFLPTQAPDYSSQEALEAFVSESHQAYALVKSASKKACGVPVEASQRWSAQHKGQELPRLKRLTHALIAKAKLAELEGRTSEAFEAQIEAYRFADAIGRGGLSPDFLYSMSCRGLVLRDCQSLIPCLTPPQKSELLKLIHGVEADQDRPGAVAEHTLRWQRATFGFKGQLDEWQESLHNAWQSRSWAPLATHRSVLARKKTFYEQAYLTPFYRHLAAPLDLNATQTEPDSAANRSQPVGPPTNRTPTAADARR
jgi:hypothetical protein